MPNEKKQSILIVDDTPDNILILMETLKTEHAVAAAKNSVSINENPQQLETNGIFQFWMPLSPTQNSQMKIVAIDTQGKRADEV